MEFGTLFTSHANTEIGSYPRRDAHARVTREILRVAIASLELFAAGFMPKFKTPQRRAAGRARA
jgi:hypothetical protein